MIKQAVFLFLVLSTCDADLENISTCKNTCDCVDQLGQSLGVKFAEIKMTLDEHENENSKYRAKITESNQAAIKVLDSFVDSYLIIKLQLSNILSAQEFESLKKENEDANLNSKKHSQELLAEVRNLAAVVRELKNEQNQFVKDVNSKIIELTAEIRNLTAPVNETKDEDQQIEVITCKESENFNVTQCPSKCRLNLTTLANGKTYFFSHEKELIWNDARDSCKENQMHLASPKTQEELNQLHRMAKQVKNGWWWLSATDVRQEGGEFRWHDGSPLYKYSTLWDRQRDYYPRDFPKGTCVHIFTGAGAKVSHHSCNTISYFICEVPAECL